MISFKDFVDESDVYSKDREETIHKLLSEMPYLNKIPRSGEWTRKNIDDLWELVEGEDLRDAGTLRGESVKILDQMGTRYVFLLKDNKPVFACLFLRRIEINAWQEDVVSKDLSDVNVPDLYAFLNKKLHMAICSSQNHSEGMKKVWLKMLKVQKFETYAQSTSRLESFTQVENPEKISSLWPSKHVFRINKFK